METKTGRDLERRMIMILRRIWAFPVREKGREERPKRPSRLLVPR